jgi:Tol biopolymer transport system component
MKRIALVILAVTLAAGVLGAQDLERLFKAAVNTETVDRNYKAAIEQYRKVAAGNNRPLAAQALFRMAECHQKLGDEEARKVYERLIRDFSDQREVIVQARARLESLAPDVRTVRTGRRMVPVWTGEGVGYGKPSLDGRYIAFQAGTGDLAVHDVVTNTTRRLTNTGGWLVSGDFTRDPIVSPDNRSVAYTWYIEADGMSELRVLSTQGASAAPRTLIRMEDRFSTPLAWTPDGTRLVISRQIRDVFELGIVSVSDGEYQTLKSLGTRNPGSEVSLSPDGRYVAYQTSNPDSQSKRDIMILSIDGSSEVAALAGPEDDFNPFWSPDGAHLVFMRVETPGVALWAAPMRNGRPNGQPTLIRSDLGRMNPLGITRSGSLYYALSGAVRHDIYIAQLDNFVATTSRFVASQGFDGRTGPAWTPDGTLLSYWAAGSQPAVTLRSVASGQERTIALPSGTVTNVVSPKWFPDGRSILLFVRADGNQATLAKFGIDTGSLERLVTGVVGAPGVAPDGSAIYWMAPGRLMRLDLATRQEQELKRDEGLLAIAVSPDGNQLAYLKNERTAELRAKGEAPGYLEIIPARGGEPRRLFRAPVWYGPSRQNTLAWSPDQQSLLAVQDDGMLWRFPLNGSAPQNMGISADKYQFEPGQSRSLPPGDRRVKSPAIHPDGKTLAFALAEVQDREIWSLENFLPSRK